MSKPVEVFEDATAENNKKPAQTPAKKPLMRRRKKAALVAEDYYSLLGVSSDADISAIKENYLKMVKKYPPERYAKKFRSIRQAYEVLQDAQKRKEYDILAFYGESVNDLLEEASSGCRMNAAKVKLLERAVKIDPLHVKAQLSFAMACLMRKGKASFEERFEIMKNTFSAQEWPGIWQGKISILLQCDYFEEAFEEAQRLQGFDSHSIGKYYHMYLDVYSALERETELLAVFEKYHQSLACPKVEDLVVYTAWIQVANILFRENKLPTARQATEKFIRRFLVHEEREQLSRLLSEEYQEYFEDKDIRCAKILIDLACFADSGNKKLKQYSRNLQETSVFIDEISRALRDDKIFPPVIMEIVPEFIRTFDINDSMLGLIAEQYDDYIRARFEDMAAGINLNELYAVGILRLKKKYPLLYRRFQPQWDNVLREKTMGMNREERRSFRI